MTAEDIALAAEKNLRISHNPGSNMKLASGVAPLPELLAAGVIVSVGTDGASSNNNLDLLEEMHLAALLHKVKTLDPLAIPAKTAFEIATINGAKALGLENTGEIAVGKKADLTIFSMDGIHWYPRHDTLSLLTYAANSSDVHTVIVNGQILLDNRELTTIDEEKLKYDVHKKAQRLVGNV
jgi:5-methylthioadenosine/S-adenosylhomocysteine deaminase